MVEGVLVTINPCESDERKRRIAHDVPDSKVEPGTSYFIE